MPALVKRRRIVMPHLVAVSLVEDVATVAKVAASLSAMVGLLRSEAAAKS
jgi:hypothetical protein